MVPGCPLRGLWSGSGTGLLWRLRLRVLFESSVAAVHPCISPRTSKTTYDRDLLTPELLTKRTVTESLPLAKTAGDLADREGLAIQPLAL